MPIIENKDGFELLSIKSKEDWDLLSTLYSSKYRGKHVFSNIVILAQRIKCLTILIEHNYIDSCYRDQFSFLYSKSFKEYPGYCTRLHLFDIAYQNIDEIKNSDAKDLGYLGFIIISPLDVGNIGRTVLRPPTLDVNRYYYLCASSFKTHIFGKELTVAGMPFIQQDTMVMRCAQASIWMALQFMKEEYDLRAPSPSEITINATKYINLYGRTAPSEGLVAQQLLNALSSMGYSPLFYVKKYMEKEHKWEPMKIIYRYIESQIPVIAVLSNHVITIVGHVFKPTVKIPEVIKNANIVTSDLWTSAFIIHDDANGPYRLLPSPTENLASFEQEGLGDLLPSRDSKCKTVKDINSIIIPLPPKVYLPAQYLDIVEEIVKKPNIINAIQIEADKGNQDALEYKSSLDPQTTNPLVLRSYLIISEKYKSRLDTLVGMSQILREQYKKMKMPRFIWITEITTASRLSEADEEKRTIFGEVILDATATRFGPAWLSIHVPGWLFLRNPNAPLDARYPTINIPDDSHYNHHSRKLDKRE